LPCLCLVVHVTAGTTLFESPLVHPLHIYQYYLPYHLARNPVCA
jgi:hypothetical protein